MMDGSRQVGGRQPREEGPVASDAPSMPGRLPSYLDWRERWASMARLSCASDLVESHIVRLRDLQVALSSLSSKREVGDPAEHVRVYERITRLDEVFGCFTSFMRDLRKNGFFPSLIGQSFTDPLFRYFSSSRRLTDFAEFRAETPLPPGYTQLHAKLFCQEIDRYVKDLGTLFRSSEDPAEVSSSTPDIEIFMEMIIDPLVWLRSSEWVDVIGAVQGLVAADILGQQSLLAVVRSLVQRAHSTEASLERLCEATCSLRGELSFQDEAMLYGLGESFARKRTWDGVFERPFISAHPIVEFGYCAELLCRLAGFCVTDALRKRDLLEVVLQHPVMAYVTSSETAWYRGGIARMQAAMVEIMNNHEPDCAIGSLRVGQGLLWKEWDDLGALWRGATHGAIFGGIEVQHTFLSYILQNPHAVASLKGILAEARTPFGATYQLVKGLRNILRERRLGPLAIVHEEETVRALEILAHTGYDGVAAAPEVLRFLGISAYHFPFSTALISPPWPSAMDSDWSIQRRARALLAQWEDKYGPLSQNISRKLARWDSLFGT